MTTDQLVTLAVIVGTYLFARCCVSLWTHRRLPNYTVHNLGRQRRLGIVYLRHRTHRTERG